MNEPYHAVPILRARWVCPKNGEPTICRKCGTTTAPHRVESVAWDAPICETHGVMVRASEERPIERLDPEPATEQDGLSVTQDDADFANRRRNARHLSPVPSSTDEDEEDDVAYAHRPHAKAVADAARRRGFDR
jgi:hypothetical protein